MARVGVALAALWLWMGVGGSPLRRWSDLRYGKIRSDGVEYFDFLVHDDDAQVALTVSWIRDGNSLCGDCGSTADVLLRYRSFPTMSNHDQRSLISQSDPALMEVEQLRTGRYYVSVSGGELFDSAPALVGSERDRQFLINITYTTCTQHWTAGDDDLAEVCAEGTALDIALPLNDESVFPSANYKTTPRSVEGCVDSLHPTLRFTFQVEKPQWDLTLTLSTTFAAGFWITVFKRHHSLTAFQDGDRLLQSASISPGAGFRSTSVHFTAPPMGQWIIIISGNLTDNSTCADNAGAVFALGTLRASRNCSDRGKESIDNGLILTSAMCAADSLSLGPIRISGELESNALDSWYSPMTQRSTRCLWIAAEDGLQTPGSRFITANITLRTFACSDHDQDACSSHGKCSTSLSTNGRSYSSCRYDYGFAGELCDSVSIDRTYRGTQIFFVMISNAAILPTVWLSCRRQLRAEVILFTATGVVSTLYHACAFDVFCALHLRDLSRFDSALMLNMIAVLIVHITGARDQLKAGLLVFYLLSAMLIPTDDGQHLPFMWVIFAVLCCVQLSLAVAYYIVVGSQRMGLGKSIALKAFLFHSKNFDCRYGIAGCFLFGVGGTCWFMSTSSSYWILHSLWHVSVMLATFCIIALRLTDRYQLITPDFSIDVLATPPQFRFAVSSVKSVDILEDMSERSRAIAWR